MYIKDTNANFSKLKELKDEINFFLGLSDIEQKTDGAVVKSDYYNFKESCNLFKNWVKENYKFTEDEFNKYISFKEFKHEELNNNKFVFDLMRSDIKDFNQNNISFYKISYEQGEFAISGLPTIDWKNQFGKLNISVFDGYSESFCLSENEHVWMSVCPQEMNTMKRPIENSFGNVLVLGGGIGYFPYMIAQKDNVKSITIIEKNPIIKDFLENVIFKKITDNIDKIHIVLDDSVNYLSKNVKNFDYVFIDTWENNIDGKAQYLNYLPFEISNPDIKFDYWIEDSILFFFALETSRYLSAKLGTDDYIRYFKLICPDVWERLENCDITISNPRHIEYYISKEQTKNILKDFLKNKI